MREYVVRRLLLIIPTLFVVSVLVFLLIRMIPGKVVEMMAMQHVQEQSQSFNETPLSADTIKKALGLDVPIPKQFINWVGDMITHGSLGTSLWTQKPVLIEIKARIGVTFELGLLSFLIAQLIAFPIGIYAAIRQETAGDYTGRIIAILSMATPSFWLATMIMVFPSIWWGWAPPMQLVPLTKDPAGNLLQFIIPATLIGTHMTGTTMRMLRATMLDVLKQDYIRTAWSKGLRERVVIIRHAAKNAMLPVITIVSGQVGILWGGVVIMEQIFNLPGMGRLFVDAVFKRDYPFVSGISLIFAALGLLLTLACDLSYAWLDPRIRYRAFK